MKRPAKALLERFGSLRGVLDAPLPELRSVAGVGEVAAIGLRVIRESATLYLQEASEGAEVLRDPQRLGDFWRMRIGALGHEVFAVAYLDSAYRLLRNGVETLQEGTIDRAAVYPRRVVEAALRREAAALVLAHNHPSGNVAPERARQGAHAGHRSGGRDHRPAGGRPPDRVAGGDLQLPEGGAAVRIAALPRNRAS